MLTIIKYTMEHQWSLGLMCLILLVVPVIGMDLVHKYNWQHWEPFTRKHK